MAILSRKLKNHVIKRAAEKGLVVHAEVKNIRINSSSVGCSGFFGNLRTGRVVYINTEASTRDNYLYRYAKNMKDYTGGHNQFADDFEELVDSVVELLVQTKPHKFYETKEAALV